MTVRGRRRVTVPTTPNMLKRVGMTTQARGKPALLPRRLEGTKTKTVTPGVATAHNDGGKRAARDLKISKTLNNLEIVKGVNDLRNVNDLNDMNDLEDLNDVDRGQARETGAVSGGNGEMEDGGERTSEADDERDSGDWSLPLAGRGWSIAQPGKGKKNGRKDNLQRSRRVQVLEGEPEEPSTPTGQRRVLFKAGGGMTEKGATPESTHVPSRALLQKVRKTLSCWNCQAIGELRLDGSSGKNRIVRCQKCKKSRSGRGLLLYAQKEIQRMQQCAEAGIPASRHVELPEVLQAGESWPALTVAEGAKGDTDRKVLVPEDTLLDLVKQVRRMGREIKALQETVQALTVEKPTPTYAAAAAASPAMRSHVTRTAPMVPREGPTPEVRTTRPQPKANAQRLERQAQRGRDEEALESGMAEVRRELAAGVIRPAGQASAGRRWRVKKDLTATYAVYGRTPAGRLRRNLDRLCGRSGVVLSLSSIGTQLLEVVHRVSDGELLREALSSLQVKIMPTTFVPYRGTEMAEREACLKRWQRLVMDARPLARAWYTSRIAEVTEVGGPELRRENEKAPEPEDEDDLDESEDGGPVEPKEGPDQTAEVEGRNSEDSDDSTSDEPGPEIEPTAKSGQKASNSRH